MCTFTLKRFEQYGMTNKIYWTPTDADQGRDDTFILLLDTPFNSGGKNGV
jgi:hypothetical protein